MATDIGKVGIVMKGDYNSANAYEVLDAVSYNGGLYIAKQDVPANTAPTNTTYWQAGITRNLTLINTTYNFTSSASLECTGASITIPANSNFALSISAVWMNAQPLELVVSSSDTILAPYNTFFSGEYANASISGRTSSTGITLYIWAKYNGAAENMIGFNGWYETV